ncbi:unnamed protein product [Closterium sp. Naga37s-1]|nr:unnamed protein product [Closterium sp. Naga37s-1]
MTARLKEAAQRAWDGRDLPFLSLQPPQPSVMHGLRPQPAEDKTCTAAAASSLLRELGEREEMDTQQLSRAADAIDNALLHSATSDSSSPLSAAQPSTSPLTPAPLPCPCAICSRRALISASLLLSASALPADSADSAAAASAQTAEAAQAALAAVRGGKWRWQEELFAWMMATGMKEYEESVEGYKLALFEPLRSEIGRVTGGQGGEAVGGEGTVESGSDAVFRVVEIGVGAGPNFRFYTQNSLQTQSAPGSASAKLNAFSSLEEGKALCCLYPLLFSRLLFSPLLFFFVSSSFSLFSLSLLFSPPSLSSSPSSPLLFLLPSPSPPLFPPFSPLPSPSLFSLSLFLTPSLPAITSWSTYYFLEHVAAPQGTALNTWQRLLDPLQSALADGCHLTRSPLTAIKLAGFGAVQAREVMVPGLSLLAPHVVGTAVKA